MNTPNHFVISPWLAFSAWMSRLFLWCVLAVWLLIAVAWATLQLWIVPRIGDFRPALEMRASAALGVPVRIGRLTARPDGLIPAFELQDVSLLDPKGREALRLPLVLVSLTPRSLTNGGFEQLFVDRPVLDVRRLADGRIEVAGLDFARPNGGDSGALDWIFSQREFVVQGGTVRWIDESLLTAAARGAAPPPLALQRLDLVMRNSARSHALRVDATPPVEWGARFTVAGRFRQPLLSLRSGEWQSWAGQLFADFSHVDISQLRRYANLGADVRAGSGALRVWADVAGGHVDGVTADLALAEVDVQLDPQLEPLGLQLVTGRLAARRLSGGFELSTQNLRFSTRDGLRWPGGNVLIASRAAQGSQPAGGEFRADAMDLAALAQIANRLPVGTATHALMAGYAPRGRMEALRLQWQGVLGAIEKFEAQGKLSQLELAAQRSGSLLGTGTAAHEAPGRPGLRGATVEFKATEAGGSARVQMAHGVLDLPGVFEDPQIPVDHLSADLQWKISGQRLELNVPNLHLANADAQTDLKLSWHTADGPTGRFPGVMDLQGSLSRVNGTRVHRYLPLAMPKLTRDYLREAIVGGTASGVKLRLRGDLHDFPFADARRGEFQIAGQVSNATFAYAPRIAGRDLGNFPALQQLSGELVIDRNTLEVRNASGRLAGAPGLQITQAQARIPDLSHSTTVVVSADAKGPLAEMVGVVNNSALSGLTGQVLARTTATGNAELKLRLNLPVMSLDRSKVQGSVTLAGNDVQISPAVPMLARTRGVLGFNETGVSQANVQARFLGGDLRVDGGARAATAVVAGAPAAAFEPTAVFRAQGTVTADGLRQATEMGMVSRLAQSATGQAGYAAVVSLRRGVPEIAVTSSLQGMALGLPAPLAKTAEASLPLRFETSLLRDAIPAAAGAQKLQDQIFLEIGKVASITYQRDISGTEPRVLRGAIAVGLAQGESAPLPEEGVVANINFARIDLDAWESLLSNASGVSIAQASAGRTRAADLALGYLPSVIAVRATELVLEGRKLNHVVVGGSRDGLTWRANLDARELNGYVEYRQPGGAGPGRLYARLARMEIGQSTQADIETTLDGQPGSVPALDIVVEDLELRGKRLGRVEIDAVNRGAGLAQREGGVREWRLNRLNVSMPEGTFAASGNWAAVGADASAAAGRRPAGERRRTVMNFRLDVGDAGELLKRLGQPGVIRSGRGKLEGQVAWLGSPLALDYPSLGGQFNVNVENGQFLKADPGIAKLLGVLSLQSLPRRLALDFRDVFTEGFAFDFIRGDVQIDQGLAATNNLQMKGVNAGVLIEGKADIARETQDLKVTVVPEIDAGTASLFTTFINPAVGLGTFLAQLFLRRPLIQAATQEFHIDGSWADPKMTKVERKPAPADGKPESKVETRNEVAAPVAQ